LRAQSGSPDSSSVPFSIAGAATATRRAAARTWPAPHVPHLLAEDGIDVAAVQEHVEDDDLGVGHPGGDRDAAPVPARLAGGEAGTIQAPWSWWRNGLSGAGQRPSNWVAPAVNT
jgi:hypothetical protein